MAAISAAAKSLRCGRPGHQPSPLLLLEKRFRLHSDMASALRLPHFEKRAVCAEHRVFAGPFDLRNRVDASFVLLGVSARPALVIGAGRRISPDHEKIFAGSQALVTGACRKNDDVTGAQL